jgi:hypothetical protein
MTLVELVAMKQLTDLNKQMKMLMVVMWLVLTMD